MIVDVSAAAGRRHDHLRGKTPPCAYNREGVTHFAQTGAGVEMKEQGAHRIHVRWQKSRFLCTVDLGVCAKIWIKSGQDGIVNSQGKYI